MFFKAGMAFFGLGSQSLTSKYNNNPIEPVKIVMVRKGQAFSSLSLGSLIIQPVVMPQAITRPANICRSPILVRLACYWP